MYNFLILLGMIFCHIIDDYYLQGVLAKFKQKEWWKNNCPDKLYRHDYIMALFMHSFSWSASIMIIPTLYILYNNINFSFVIIFMFFMNIITHMLVDNLKANYKVINLVQDQIIHILQIYITWVVFVEVI